MTTPGAVAAVLAPSAVRPLLAPTFLALAATAAVVTAVLYTERPQLTRRAVVALVPWMVVAASLVVLAPRVDYPTAVEPVVRWPGAYVTTYVIVCLVWFALIQVGRGARRRGSLPNYLGAMGVGAVLVVLAAVLLTAEGLGVTQLFWLAMAPIVAAAVAAVVLVLLGLWYTEAAAYTGAVGGLVVFGHALAAIATAVAVVSGGDHSLLSGADMLALSNAGAADAIGVDLEVLWAWSFVWTKLVVATAVVVLLATYTREHPTRGNLVLGLVAAVGIVGGVTSLLTYAVGA